VSVADADVHLRALLVAPPGAGKGTQAARLSRHFGVPTISTGEVFRREVAAGTELGRQVAEYLDLGDLVPDDLVGQVVRREVVAAVGATGGYLLDGFPRTVHQAEAAHAQALELGIEAQAVVTFDVPRPVLLQRLLNRGGEGRSDDDIRTIRHRLDVYDQQTEPLLDYYAARSILIRIDANRSVDEVTAATIDVLEQVLASSDEISVHPK
jgi:adenylate kinase